MYGIRADCTATADVAGELDSYYQDNEKWTDVEKLVIKNIEFRFIGGVVRVADGNEDSVCWDVFPASFWNVFPSFGEHFQDAVIEAIKNECHRSGQDYVK